MGPRGLKTIPRGCGGSHSENGVSFRSIGKKYDAIFGQKWSKNSDFPKKNRKFYPKMSKKKGYFRALGG